MLKTPLYDALISSGAQIGEYSGVRTATVFSGVVQEFSELHSGCAVYDLNWRAKIVITGEDRVRWLNGMVTNSLRDLPLNHGNYNFLLNPQGRILADMYIYNRGEYLLLDTDRSQLEAVMKTLDHYIIMDDVELADSSETLGAIGICGPKANEVLAALHVTAADKLEPLEVRDLVINNLGISVVRGPEQKSGWYEIW